MTAPARDRGTSTGLRRARGRPSAASDPTGATAGTGTRTRTAGGGSGKGARQTTTPTRGGTGTRNGSRSGAGRRATTTGTARRRPATEPASAPSRQRSGARAAAEGATLRDRVLDWPRSRSSFVLVLMALMVAGVATTLWLSTQAIADSWRLQELRDGNTELTERVERLQREVGQLQSPSSLAERAEALGMVPAGPAARLVEDGDGGVTVVGEPEAATPPPDGGGPGVDSVDGAAGAGGADDGT